MVDALDEDEEASACLGRHVRTDVGLGEGLGPVVEEGAPPS